MFGYGVNTGNIVNQYWYGNPVLYVPVTVPVPFIFPQEAPVQFPVQQVSPAVPPVLRECENHVQKDASEVRNVAKNEKKSVNLAIRTIIPEENLRKYQCQRPFVPRFLTNDYRYIAMVSESMKKRGVKGFLSCAIKRIFRERWPDEFRRRQITKDWKDCGIKAKIVVFWTKRVEEENLCERNGFDIEEYQFRKRCLQKAWKDGDRRMLKREKTLKQGNPFM